MELSQQHKKYEAEEQHCDEWQGFIQGTIAVVKGWDKKQGDLHTSKRIGSITLSS